MSRVGAAFQRRTPRDLSGRYGTGVIEGYRGPGAFLFKLFAFLAMLGAVCWLSLANI